MTLRDPQRGIQVVLQDGPRTAVQIEKHVRGAADWLLIMEREGLVARDGELWRLKLDA